MSAPLLTLAEAADLLHVSQQTVRGLIRDGRIRPVRICRRLLFKPEDIQQLVSDAQQ